MSFWSSKTRVSVFSTALNMIDSGGDINASSIISSILGGTSIVEDLIENQLQSILPKVSRMLSYAESDYTYGLPQGAAHTASGNESAIEAVIGTLVGHTVEVLSSVIAVQDSSVYEWPDNTLTTGLTKGQLYYFVIYMDLDPVTGIYIGVQQQWVYLVSQGTHPTLTITAQETLNSPYYPIVPIRRDNVDLTDSSLSSTPLYQTSEKLLEHLGISYTGIGESINTNPDIAEIDHAYIMFGVSIDSVDKASIKYMYEYFSYLHGRSNYSALDDIFWQGGTKKSGSAANIISMEDAGSRMQVSYSDTFLDVKVGNIGPIGHITKDIIVLPPESVTKTIFVGEEGDQQELLLYELEKSYVVFKEQISPTQYLELTVTGLVHTNFIYDAHSVETTLAMAVTPNDHNFIIPLNRDIVQNIGAAMRTNLMYDSLKIVFNSYVLTKVKWYESGAFSFIIKAVGIAITIMSMGADGGWGATIALSLGLVAGTVAFAITVFLVNTAIGMAIGEAFKIFAKVFGADIAFLMIMAGMAYGGYAGTTKGGLKGMPWAEELLTISNSGISGINANTAELLEDINEEILELADYSEEQLDMLKDISDELNAGTLVDPMDFIKTDTVLFADNDVASFYQRTIHTGNVGVLSLQATQNYVDNMLALPTAGSTINNLNFTGA